MSDEMKSIEIEIKAHVDDPQKVLGILKEKAKLKKKYFKKDTYFAKNGSTVIGEMLRLRREKGSYVFTMKKKTIVNKTEVNEEREMEVSKRTARKFLKLITGVMGYSEYVRKDKKGRAYTYRGVLAELSEVIGLGHFIELELLDSELPQEEQLKLLREVLAELEIDEAKIEERPYVKLLKEGI